MVGDAGADHAAADDDDLGAVGQFGGHQSAACTSSSSLRQVRPLELGHRTLITFHRPFPEVEFDCAGTVLYAAPQCPAVLADDALQVGAGGLVAQPAPVVGGDEIVELVGGHAGLAPGVAQLETRVVVARVLVVDQPHPVAVFDEVPREQVVVARHGGLVGRPQHPGDLVERVGVVEVVRREAGTRCPSRSSGRSAASRTCRSGPGTAGRRAGRGPRRRPCPRISGRWKSSLHSVCPSR